MTDYFKKEAPELTQWLSSTSHGEDVLRQYQQGRNDAIPALNQLNSEFTATLYDYLSRAQHYAGLSCLPHALLLDQPPQIRPSEQQRTQRAATVQRLEEAQRCRKNIAEAATHVTPPLVRANQDLIYMEMLKNGIVPPTDRADYLRMRARFSDGRQPESPFREACAYVTSIEIMLEQLHNKANAAPMADTYGNDQSMVEECRRYAQNAMYPDLKDTFHHLRVGLEQASIVYDTTAREVALKLKPEPRKKSFFQDRNANPRTEQEVAEALKQQGEGSNVVSIASARHHLQAGRS